MKFIKQKHNKKGVINEMAIYQRKLSTGTYWFYKFKRNGVLYRSRAIYTTKQEAKEAETEAYQEAIHREKHPFKPQEVTLLSAINQRLDYVKSRKSLSYYNDNRRYLKILLNTFGDVPLQQISKQAIEALLSETSQRLGIDRTGNYTVNAMIRTFKALFNFIGEYNPLHKVEFYPVDKKIKFIPSNGQIEEVLKICTPEQQDLITFILETGARISEALSLKGNDITNVSVTLYTRKSNNSDRMPRQVPKPSCLVGKTFPADKLVFHYWSDNPKFLKRKIQQLKQPMWGFHSLRHRRASLWSKEGKPLFEIMSLLGHSSLSTTQIYLRLLPDVGDTLVTNYKEIRVS